MEIMSTDGGIWTLNSFGAYGPYRSLSPNGSVYMFTKAEARRVIKQGGGRLKYTMLQIALIPRLHPSFDSGSIAVVTITLRSIRFGCQKWDGVHAKQLRQWALSK